MSSGTLRAASRRAIDRGKVQAAEGYNKEQITQIKSLWWFSCHHAEKPSEPKSLPAFPNKTTHMSTKINDFILVVAPFLAA
jgi:hypothetical protein